MTKVLPLPAAKRLADEGGRELIRTALDRNIIVEAAAGTGKTTELVNRIVAVLAEGRATVASLVAVTFTEKAAGELKLRMRSALEEAREKVPVASERHARLERALSRLEEARLGTIHSFCAELLRERSVEAGVDPEFQTMTELEAERLYGEAFELWLQEQLEDPPEGVRRSLRRTARLSSDEGPVARLRQAGWMLADWRDFPTRWRRDDFDRTGRIDELAFALHEFAELVERCAKKDSDNFYKDVEPARRLSLEIRTAEAVRSRDYDGLEAALLNLGDRKFGKPRKGYGKSFGEGVSREQAHTAHLRLYQALKRFAEDADADLAALLQRELLDTIRRYEKLKQRIGRLDFVDLLIRARDLIRDSEAIRSDFQKRFSHIFIDEFQDTEPLQAEILLLLASKSPAVDDWRDVDPAPGKLFLVADPKQSIYRFRRADVGIYFEVKELLRKRGAECIQLTTSFRAVASIQRAVNSVFPELMTGDESSQQASYVPLSQYRTDAEDQPSIVALPVPRPYGSRDVTRTAIEKSLPDAVGAFVEWLLHKSGWQVTEREAPEKRVPVTARHVCLLFRRFDSYFAGDVTRGYVLALEARGIRHLLVGGRSFHEREEVETIRAALCAIEWPDDELSVFATLRGSLFAISDEDLLEYRHRFGRLHPFRIAKGDLPEKLHPLVEALAFLATLHRGRNRHPIAETIHRLLETTRAHAGFALRPSGEQALANVLHVAEQARSYEGTGGLSFRGFVERLLDDAENRKAGEAPILEEGSEGVRIMTVHKAKGLEFPVVILADMTAGIARATAARAIDPGRRLCAVRIAGWSPVELLEHQGEEVVRDRAEGIRVAYVAATRARDLLVIPAIGDGPWGGSEEAPEREGWFSPLNAAIYPPKPRWGRPERAPGCPEFGSDTVLERPHEIAFNFARVKPGLHRFEEAGYGVVWWDPKLLHLGVVPKFGVRQEELLSKDTSARIVERDIARFREWERARETTLARAQASKLELRTATARAAELARDTQLAGEPRGGRARPEVEIVELPREEGRPAGPRFGALVHAVLASVPLETDAARRARTVEVARRVLGATEEEAAFADRCVARALESELLARARSSSACRRESPVTFREEDGSLVDGVIDLAFEENGSWIVVDFKTDRELEGALAVYRRQVELYARIVEKVTGREAKPVLLRV
jgi:ATP-dependent exoDNAse (exonuclease V) beta subunit